MYVRVSVSTQGRPVYVRVSVSTQCRPVYVRVSVSTQGRPVHVRVIVRRVFVFEMLGRKVSFLVATLRRPSA